MNNQTVTHHRSAEYMTDLKHQGTKTSFCHATAFCDLVQIKNHKDNHQEGVQYAEQAIIDRFDPDSLLIVQSMDDILKYSKTNGLPRKRDYKMLGKSIPINQRPQKLEKRRAIKSYKRLNPRDEKEIIDELRQSPLLVVMDIGNDFEDLEANKVYSPPTRGVTGHAMILTGCGNIGGEKYWEVKCSLGVDFSDRGYAKLSRKHIFREVYKIEV